MFAISVHKRLHELIKHVELEKIYIVSENIEFIYDVFVVFVFLFLFYDIMMYLICQIV